MYRVLITGGGGFIGRHLVPLLIRQGYPLRLTVRRTGQYRGLNQPAIDFDLAGQDNDYDLMFKDVGVVVHLAGIAHTRGVTGNDPVRLNTDGTRRLVQAAAGRGVRRFVFLSTVKVHGGDNREAAYEPASVTETSPAHPRDPYAYSKFAAEQAVIGICESSKMEYVILRSPLVYGPGVRANFLKLLQLVYHRIPLPFASVQNRRSLVYAENLCDIIRMAVDHPAMKNRVYLLKDCDFSTPELIATIAQVLNRTPLLLPFPPAGLRFLGRITNQGDTVESLTGSLLVDHARLLGDTDWQPPVDTLSAMQKTATWFLDR